MPDGTLAVNTWKLVGGILVLTLIAEGNRTRGWFQYGGKWYYFDGWGYEDRLGEHRKRKMVLLKPGWGYEDRLGEQETGNGITQTRMGI